jgi:hypothetical protein
MKMSRKTIIKRIIGILVIFSILPLLMAGIESLHQNPKHGFMDMFIIALRAELIASSIFAGGGVGVIGLALLIKWCFDIKSIDDGG